MPIHTTVRMAHITRNQMVVVMLMVMLMMAGRVRVDLALLAVPVKMVTMQSMPTFSSFSRPCVLPPVVSSTRLRRR